MPILPSDQRVGENFKFPYQVHAYELASKIPVVISQMPCYCYCERIGHGSLHTCFESNHGIVSTGTRESKVSPRPARTLTV